MTQASPFQALVSGGMWVAMWIAPWHPSTAARTAAGSNRSTVTGSAPWARSWSAFSGERAAPRTS